MNLAALVLALAASSLFEPTADTVARGPVMEERLVIPDEIAPAVMPYLGCLLARDGVEVRGRLDPRPAGVGPGADCTAFREGAARDADTLLRRIGGRSSAEREALIEQTLTSIEAFPNPGATAPRSESNAQNR